VTATLPAGSAANALLQRLGFTFVELSLETYFVPKGELARPAAALRQAEEIDWPGIERIAGSAFRHGRYHADPGFPSELADRRYIRWMRNARAATSHGATHGDIVYVLGEAGAPRAFFHVALREDGVGDLRLGAVDPQASNGMLGVALYRGVIAALRELGARSFVTRLSASNTAVLNLFASMGFLFRDPTCIYNRHTPEQP
ncbi:MAG TPA: hypothetical protein VMH02_06280, partial [Verrucomicrobiae bacterium]|nr:hypothetical protein [Verrucomicrobiae bacterium]